ncbi:hypothetical protein evm_002239 [Chilo suppressalis]|nr:hypothetical protein evm_002239 [Chilo suppressalis]
MSTASFISSKREKTNAELTQEIESIKSLNVSLQAYLEHVRTFRKSLNTMNSNCQQLSKVNTEWIDLLNGKT